MFKAFDWITIQGRMTLKALFFPRIGGDCDFITRFTRDSNLIGDVDVKMSRKELRWVTEGESKLGIPTLSLLNA